MGYRRQRPSYRLVFEDAEYVGLEVVAQSASIEAYQRIATLATREVGEHPTAEDLEEVANLLKAFAGVLVSWNLETEAGEPVPATLDGLRSQDLPLVMVIVLAWMNAVAGVSAPLGAASSSGELVASLPMEPLQPSL